MKKLSLNALKNNAETVLNKDELRTLKGGYQTCSYNGGWGPGCPDPYNPNCTGQGQNYNGYKVACYENSTFLGYACTGGTCSGEQGSYCSSQGYPTTNYAYCV